MCLADGRFPNQSTARNANQKSRIKNQKASQKGIRERQRPPPTTSRQQTKKPNTRAKRRSTKTYRGSGCVWGMHVCSVGICRGHGWMAAACRCSLFEVRGEREGKGRRARERNCRGDLEIEGSATRRLSLSLAAAAHEPTTLNRPVKSSAVRHVVIYPSHGYFICFILRLYCLYSITSSFGRKEKEKERQHDIPSAVRVKDAELAALDLDVITSAHHLTINPALSPAGPCAHSHLPYNQKLAHPSVSPFLCSGTYCRQ